MPVVFIPPASIECSEASITARKIIPIQPIRNTHSELRATLLYRFKLDLNSEAFIVRELSPKQAIIDRSSMLDSGDGIKGDMISGFSTTLMKPDKAKVQSAIRGGIKRPLSTLRVLSLPSWKNRLEHSRIRLICWLSTHRFVY